MKASELASRLGLELRGDGEAEVWAPAPLEAAAPGTVTFAAGARYLARLRARSPSCIIVAPELAGEVAAPALLISPNPYADFARTLAIFFPPYRPGPGIDVTARIAPDAKIGAQASIGAYCVIGSGASIGRNAVIHPHVTIYPGVRVGDDFVCHSQVSIRENVTIGNRVLIHNGVVIGADGFGFIRDADALVKIPQVGTVIVADDVEIGANTTIDRAMMGATVVQRGVKLDNLIHIAHNCEVGEYSRFAAQVGLAGSVSVGKWCEFGGQAGSADHIRVGDRVRVVAQAGMPRSVPDDAMVGGTPAMDMRAFRRMAAVQARLPELLKRLRALEERIGQGSRVLGQRDD